ncbi:hypothetical protein ACFLS1_01185 [Verrucomicrobiota bacterium]
MNMRKLQILFMIMIFGVNYVWAESSAVSEPAASANSHYSRGDPNKALAAARAQGKACVILHNFHGS